MARPAQWFLKSYNNSSRGVSLTPYTGVIFWGVILTPKWSLKNSFSGVKMTPNIEELSCAKNFYSTFRVKLTPKRVKTIHVRSKNNPIFGVILTPDWE